MTENYDVKRNEHYVAKTDEIEDGERVLLEVEGRELAVFNVDGEFFALSNYCTHMGGPVCEGSLLGYITSDHDGELLYEREGEIITCPWHGWEFDVKTGHHLASSQFRLPTYEVVTKDDEIYVRL